MSTTKSYKLSLYDQNNGRKTTQIKLDLLEGLNSFFKQKYNYISKEYYSGKNYWIGITRDEKKKIDFRYNKQFQKIFTSCYSQNIYKSSLDKYNTSMITFYKGKKSGQIMSEKVRPRKPYFDNIEFPLDSRMLSSPNTFLKDRTITNLYWLSIRNPYHKTEKLSQRIIKDDRFIDYKRTINLPLYIYPEVKQYLDLGIKYSFILGKDYIKIVFSFSEEQTESLFKQQKILDKLAIDFGKYISTFDSNSEYRQYNLDKFYRSCKKTMGQIKILQSQLSELRTSKNFGEQYLQLKSEIQTLYKRITAKRKHTYNWLANKFVNVGTVISENLTFVVEPRKSDKYKGRNFNSMLNIMGKGIWKNVLSTKLTLAGSQQVIVNPAYTSQCCQRCGHISRSNRKGRVFKCGECGFTFDADMNAAKNIYVKGFVYNP